MRRLLIITLFLIFFALFAAGVGPSPAAAGEYDDAKVAFGAFADGLYDFAGAELTRFLADYPDSKMVPRARLALILCSLKTGDCSSASREFAKLELPAPVSGLKFDPADLLLRLGDCFLAAGEPAAALEYFTRVTRDYDGGDAALKAAFKLSRIYFARDDFAAAGQQIAPLLKIADSQRLKSLQLDRQAIYWMAAFSAYHQQDYKAALPLLLKISRNANEFSLTTAERQDLYAILVESAWHVGDSKLMTDTVKRWLQTPAADLNTTRFASAVLLTAGSLRATRDLSEIRSELIKLTAFALPQTDKQAVYELLLEIDRGRDDRPALKKWLKALIALLPAKDTNRSVYLGTLLQLDYESENYPETVSCGYQLIREQPQFWQQEKLYFPFLIALGRLNKCVDIVKFVPAALPAYKVRENASFNPRRLTLDLLAGSCRVKLGRYAGAVTFYRSLYDHYKDPVVRVKLLLMLSDLAGKTAEPKVLDEWICREVMTHFSLDRREDEKLLRQAPELVMLVAESLFASQSYLKALPSLLWLEKLELEGPLSERITFLLAESYYRSGEPAEALVRFEKLYDGGSRQFHHLAALRLVTIYESLGQANKRYVAPGKLEKLYRDILKWETNPELKRELERKLKDLQVKGER